MIDILKVRYNMKSMSNSYFNISMSTEFLIVLHNTQNID